MLPEITVQKGVDLREVVKKLEARVAELEKELLRRDKYEQELHDKLDEINDWKRKAKAKIEALERYKAETLAGLEKSREELMQAQNEVGVLALANKETESNLERLRQKNAELVEQLDKLADQAQHEKEVAQLSLFEETVAPTGNVTLVFTDVQGSTTQWEKFPKVMTAALAMHNRLMRDRIREHQGYEVKTEGDAFMIAFADPSNAVHFCLDVQERLVQVKWPRELFDHPASKVEHTAEGDILWRGFRVRMGVHTGEPDAQRDPVTKRIDYFGTMVNRSARVEGLASGGQVLLSSDVYDAISGRLSLFGDPVVEDLGCFRPKGIDEDIQVFQLLPKSLGQRSFPPPKTGVTEKDVTTLGNSIQKLRDDCTALTDNLDGIRSSLDRAKSDTQGAAKKLRDLNRRLSEGGVKGVLKELEEEFERLLSSHDTLHTSIDDMGHMTTAQVQIQGKLQSEFVRIGSQLVKETVLNSKIQAQRKALFRHQKRSKYLEACLKKLTILQNEMRASFYAATLALRQIQSKSQVVLTDVAYARVFE